MKRNKIMVSENGRTMGAFIVYRNTFFGLVEAMHRKIPRHPFHLSIHKTKYRLHEIWKGLDWIHDEV